MTKQDLINQIVEEMTVGSDLGYEYEHTAKNIIALVSGNRKHLDYDSTKQQYEWEERE